MRRVLVRQLSAWHSLDTSVTAGEELGRCWSPRGEAAAEAGRRGHAIAPAGSPRARRDGTGEGAVGLAAMDSFCCAVAGVCGERDPGG